MRKPKTKSLPGLNIEGVARADSWLDLYLNNLSIDNCFSSSPPPIPGVYRRQYMKGWLLPMPFSETTTPILCLFKQHWSKNIPIMSNLADWFKKNEHLCPLTEIQLFKDYIDGKINPRSAAISLTENIEMKEKPNGPLYDIVATVVAPAWVYSHSIQPYKRNCQASISYTNYPKVYAETKK